MTREETKEAYKDDILPKNMYKCIKHNFLIVRIEFFWPFFYIIITKR